MFELKVPPLLLVAIVAVAMWSTAALLPSADVPVPLRMWLTALLMVGGVGVALAGVLAFRRARTTVDPTRPDAASAIVASGVYRISRNPMYLGFLVLLVGFGVWLGNLAALAWLPLFVAWLNRFQIAPEERALLRRFGAPYDDYLRSVRRWL